MGLMTPEAAKKLLYDLLPGFDFRNGADILSVGKANDITQICINNEKYEIWSVEYIKPLLIKFLKNKFINCIISQEINDIDFVVIDNENNIIPIELQKTYFDTKEKKTVGNAHFEKVIRIQIDDNIRSSGICWFFFDCEYLRYFQNVGLNKATSIDMSWFIDYMNEGKLKVFAIRYDGLVKELTTKDFDFLKQIHSDDEIILDKNKLKIYSNVMKGHNFTQYDMDKFYEEYDNLSIKDNNGNKTRDLLIKSQNSKSVLYVNILRAIRTLPEINEIMNLKMIVRKRLFESKYLGIFELVSSRGNRSVTKFVDKFDVCKYFPGYVRNKEIWNRYKNVNLLNDQLDYICSENLVKRNQSSVDDY